MNFCGGFTDRNTTKLTIATIILAAPFTNLPTPHLLYHLSLSELQLLLVLTINIPSSISPRSMKKLACDTVVLVTK